MLEIHFGLFLSSTFKNNVVFVIKAQKTPNEKARKLLDTLVQRGPKAFRRFCEALLKTQQEHIVDLLDPEFFKSSGCSAKPACSEATSAGGDSSLERPKAEPPKPSFPQPVSVSIVPAKQNVTMGPDAKKEDHRKNDFPTASTSKVTPVQPVPSIVTSETEPRKNENSNQSVPQDASLPKPNISPGIFPQSVVIIRGINCFKGKVSTKGHR